MQNIPPILEYDPSPLAILEPKRPYVSEPQTQGAVLCFFHDVIAKLVQQGKLQKIGGITSEMGENPIYVFTEKNTRLLVTHPGVGAPLVAMFLEELITLGMKKVIVCGGCGVLDPELVAGYPLIVNAAVRDEGTSYHYLPRGRNIEASPQGIAALEQVLLTRGLPYRIVKSWTTDGYYRETEARRNCRMQEGCSIVEMEAAALFAVAKFRSVELAQIVYAGDLVIPGAWDSRKWNMRTDDRSLLFDIAVEACLKLLKD